MSITVDETSSSPNKLRLPMALKQTKVGGVYRLTDNGDKGYSALPAYAQ